MDWYDDWLLSSTSFLKQNLGFIHEGNCFIDELMKERGSGPSAFIVFECSETLMKHVARVYGMASPKGPID